jgi:hypothetical protein
VVAEGRVYLSVKQQLHRAFGSFFRENGGPHRRSQTYANRHIAIAQHPWISNSAHWAECPSSWRTLYVLTGVTTPADCEVAVAVGLIHPELRRWEAERLVRDGVVQAAREPRQLGRVLGPIVREDDARVRSLINTLDRHLRRDRHTLSGAALDTLAVYLEEQVAAVRLSAAARIVRQTLQVTELHGAPLPSGFRERLARLGGPRVVNWEGFPRAAALLQAQGVTCSASHE